MEQDALETKRGQLSARNQRLDSQFRAVADARQRQLHVFMRTMERLAQVSTRCFGGVRVALLEPMMDASRTQEQRARGGALGAALADGPPLPVGLHADSAALHLSATKVAAGGAKAWGVDQQRTAPDFASSFTGDGGAGVGHKQPVFTEDGGLHHSSFAPELTQLLPDADFMNTALRGACCLMLLGRDGSDGTGEGAGQEAPQQRPGTGGRRTGNGQQSQQSVGISQLLASPDFKLQPGLGRRPPSLGARLQVPSKGPQLGQRIPGGSLLQPLAPLTPGMRPSSSSPGAVSAFSAPTLTLSQSMVSLVHAPLTGSQTPYLAYPAVDVSPGMSRPR